MKDDPIVEEIHQVRQKLLAECNGSLERCSTDCRRPNQQTAFVWSCWRPYEHESNTHKAAI